MKMKNPLEQVKITARKLLELQVLTGHTWTHDERVLVQTALGNKCVSVNQKFKVTVHSIQKIFTF